MAKVNAIDLMLAARKDGVEVPARAIDDVVMYCDTPALCRSRADSHRKRNEHRQAAFFDCAAVYLQQASLSI